MQGEISRAVRKRKTGVHCTVLLGKAKASFFQMLPPRPICFPTLSAWATVPIPVHVSPRYPMLAEVWLCW